MFSGDQFVTYAAAPYAGVEVEGHPRPVAEHWGGLTAVAPGLRPRRRHLPVRAPGRRRRSAATSSTPGSDYTTAGPGLPAGGGPRLLGRPGGPARHGQFPVAVLFDRDNTLYLGGTQYVQYNAASGAGPTRGR